MNLKGIIDTKMSLISLEKKISIDRKIEIMDSILKKDVYIRNIRI